MFYWTSKTKTLSKTISISDPAKLLAAYLQEAPSESLEPYSLKISPVKGGAEVRLEAKGEKVALPIVPLLHPSRKWLSKGKEPIHQKELLLSPHLPEALAADLRTSGVCHADLNGRLFIQTPWLVIDLRPTGAQFRNPESAPDVFSLKTSRLARALLSNRHREWTQEELKARTEVSRGLVSRILKVLQDDGCLEKTSAATRTTPARYKVSAFDRLLDAWKAADRWAGRATVQQYSVLSSNAGEIAREILDSVGEGKAAFTQWFAAHLRFPYTTPPVVSAYVAGLGLLDQPLGRKVNSGGNLWLIHPADDGVFRETQESSGFQLVSDVQIYLDLLQVGQRGPDQAEALRHWEGFAQ
ncbi:MAG: hypothetical protein KDK99_14905 [Verrucomicrobiales bacterium]|nr:hypothetical protein [Verrucomicrobiales bacterium]